MPLPFLYVQLEASMSEVKVLDFSILRFACRVWRSTPVPCKNKVQNVRKLKEKKRHVLWSEQCPLVVTVSLDIFLQAFGSAGNKSIFIGLSAPVGCWALRGRFWSLISLEYS